MRKTPLVPVAVAMIAGIVAGHHVTDFDVTLGLTVAVLSLLAASAMRILCRKVSPAFSLPIIILIFFSLGASLCRLSDPQYDPHHWRTRLGDTQEERPHYLSLRIGETPIPRERSWRSRVDVLAVDGHPCRGNVMLFLRKDSCAAVLRYGDRLLAHTYVDPRRNTLYITGDHYIVTARNSTSLRARCESVRMKLLRRMQRGPMTPRLRGLAEALTLGWRGDLERSLQTQFRDAGILHLLCVSGLHIGMLAGMVGLLLIGIGKDRRGRILRGTVQLVVIWTFALLSGLAPATLRASLMFSFLILNRMAGRRTESLNILALAAIVMLTVDPLLLFDVGWQLSFASVAAILVSRPALALFRSAVWKHAVVSLAATLATLPIVLNTFHQVQPYFLIANILIIPFAPLLLFSSLLYMALPCSLTAWLADLLFRCCDWLTSGIAGLPPAVIDGPHPSPSGLVLLAAGIILLMITINTALSRYLKTKTTTAC